MDKIDKIEMLKLDQAKELADLIESEKLRELLPDSIKHTARIVKHSWSSEKPNYRGSYYLADWHNFDSWAGTILAPGLHGEYNKGIGGGAKEAGHE